MNNDQNLYGTNTNVQNQQPKSLTNGMAIAGFILSFFCGFPLGLIFSIIGLTQAKKCNSGKGLAIAGLIISIVEVIVIVAISCMVTIFSTLVFGNVKNTIQKSNYCSMSYDCGEPNSAGIRVCKYRDENNKEQEIKCFVDYNSSYKTTTKAVSTNHLVGTFDCKGATSSEYSMSLEFKDDNLFRYGAYNDLDNNHYSGTYVYEHETSKDGIVNGAKYYMVNLTYNKDDFIKDGIRQEWPDGRGNVGKIEIGLQTVSGKKHGALIFVGTTNTYICEER